MRIRPLDPLDRSTADRLLAGAVPPEDAPPGYADLAILVRAAGAEASSGELRREQPTIAAMSAEATTWCAAVAPPAGSRRSSKMFFKLKVATIVVGGTMAASTGLAFAGVLPTPIQTVASHAFATIGVSVPGPNSHAGNHPNSHATNHSTGSDQSSPTGPDATGPAQFGLCTAFAAGRGGTDGGKDQAVAFQNLQQAAEAAGQSVEEFCATATAGGNSARGKAPVTTPNGGGTGTANTASGGASEHGATNADSKSGDHSSADSANGHGS